MASGTRLIDANKIQYHPSGFPKGDGFDSGMDWAFREDIDKLPTVDAVEVVHGRWDYTPDHAEYCTVCGFYPDEEENHEYNYCPNCGAKMDGATEGGANDA